ncbi:MAG: lipase [Acutalibacter sp.]|nr:lipase [Acutalibacter sp.]
MKKVLKILGIALLCVIVLVVSLLIWLANQPAVRSDYTQKVETGGGLEGKYIQPGPHTVEVCEQPVPQGFGKYVLCYPTQLEDSQYPVVVYANGSGIKASKYRAVLEHMASWGFIAIGTEEEYDWNGFASEMCVRHLETLNQYKEMDEKPNQFYGKIDMENVGIIGHSQGGVGVINAITEQKHAGAYKAAVALSPTNKELAAALEWEYDALKIHTPILLLAGAGGGDDWVVTGEQLDDIYSDIDGSRAMARRKDTPHGDMLFAADGYATAWFMWLLQGDEEAGKAFSGKSPEIFLNNLYQDVKIEMKQRKEEKS